MVKVISAYNFQEQNTYTISGDIVDTCLIGNDRLAIAQRNHLIEILCLKHKNSTNEYSSLSTLNNENVFQNDQNKNSPPTKTMFPTVDQVQKMLYCKAGHFLVTLESKTDTYDELQKRFIRIYVNFDIVKVDNCFTTPIRARIASRVTPKTDSTNCIEVIEIPFNGGNPDTIACCQTSGTIVISSEKNLYFYELKTRANLAQKFTFIDFIEVPFYIELEFIPKKLKICENVIGCMNETITIAFKIIDLIETNTEDGSTSNSLTTGSSANIFNQSTNNIPIDYEVAKQCNQINGIELQLKVRSNWDTESNGSKTNFSEEKPVPVNDVKILLKHCDEYNNEHDGIFYSVKSLLQLRQPSLGKVTGQIHDEFRSIALKPIYCKYEQKSDEIKKSPNSSGHVFKSSSFGNCIGFSFFVSTVSDGYLYQFTNQEKWYVENTKCLATYPFTAPVLDVIIDNYVIHAITECGIETFSSRVGHKLFSSYYEYPMLTSSHPNEVFQIGPLLDVPICVMGICGFFGIKFVVNSDTNLILLSNYDDENKINSTSTTTVMTSSMNKKQSNNHMKNSIDDMNNDWTLYNLKLPQPETLINDIKNLANIYRNSCPDVYYELMEEAYVIIRLARIFIDNNENDDDSEEKDRKSEILERIFMETCQLLAEYTIMSDRKEIYSQAVAYYSMCKYPVWEIYKRFIFNLKELNIEQKQQQQQQQTKNYNNLIYTLKILLTSLKSNKTDAEYLTQNVKPIINQEKKLSSSSLSPMNKEYNVAEEFLNFFKMYAPNEIAPICLISSVFRDIINDSLIELFSKKSTKKLSSDEQLCYILCLFKNNQLMKAIEILDKMKPKYLLQSLKKYWIIIFDNFNLENYRNSTFSDFTELILFSAMKSKIIEVIADIFIHLLLVTHYIDLDFILNRFMNYFALNLGQKGYRQSQQILEILLQSYFYDLYYLNNRNILIMNGGGTANGTTNTTIAEQFNNSTILPTMESHNSLSAYLMNTHDQLQSNSINNKQIDEIQLMTTVKSNHIQDYNYEDAEQEAMKILFRMYLGWLKQYSDAQQRQKQQQQNHDNDENKKKITKNHSHLPDDQIFGYRLAFIEYMFHHSKIIKRMHAKFDKTYSSDLSYGSDQMISIYDDSACVQTPDDDNDDDDDGNDENDSKNHDANIDNDDDGSRTKNQMNNDCDDKSKLLFRRRPILFFERRELFLNTMPPFDENTFKMDTNGSLYFNDWDKDVNIILIKIQALLNSGKLNGNLIDDFITFIHSNPNVIGIDSLIAILLPKPEGEEFLIHVMPKSLLSYAKSRLIVSQQWQALIKRILNKKQELKDSEIELVKFYDKIIYEILEYLANTKTLEEFLNCIPEEELNKNQNHNNCNYSSTRMNGDNDEQEQSEQDQQPQCCNSSDSIELRKHSYDGIDETDPFQLIMRTVVAKQRSDALCAMIQSTGRQLYDAMNNSQLHLN